MPGDRLEEDPISAIFAESNVHAVACTLVIEKGRENRLADPLATRHSGEGANT